MNYQPAVNYFLLCYFVISFPLEMEGLDIFQQRQETPLMYITLKDDIDHAGASILIEVKFPSTLHIMDMMSGQISVLGLPHLT